MGTSDDEIVSEEETEEGPAALKKLRERLKKAVEEKQGYLEGWQRSRADFVNYKKEEASAVEEKGERLRADFMEEMLPALDALELAVKHGDATAKMLDGQFVNALKKLGIERIGQKGEEFDPRLHEAIVKKTDDHVVISVERSGYKTGDKIIRPAQVII